MKRSHEGSPAMQSNPVCSERVKHAVKVLLHPKNSFADSRQSLKECGLAVIIVEVKASGGNFTSFNV